MLQNSVNWIYPEIFSKIGQKLSDFRAFEESSNLTLTTYRFSWPDDMTLGHIDLKFEDNVYKGCLISYAKFKALRFDALSLFAENHGRGCINSPCRARVNTCSGRGEFRPPLLLFANISRRNHSIILTSHFQYLTWIEYRIFSGKK